MADSDDDVLGLGKRVGSKRSAPTTDSEEEKEKEDTGFQLESPPKEETSNKRPRQCQKKIDEGCKPEVAKLMVEGSLFLVLLARDKELIIATKNLIGNVEFVGVETSRYPDFRKQLRVSHKLPCVVLMRGWDVVATRDINTSAEQLATLVAENIN